MDKVNVKRRIFRDDTIPAYILMAPMLIGFIVFSLYPIFFIVEWSWFEYDGIREPIFIGIENFVRVFTRSNAFWMSLANTFIITIGKTLIEIPLALVLAVLINKKGKLNTLFRSTFFLPSIVSIAIVGLIFSIIFQSYGGAINMMLEDFGVISRYIDWFSNKWTAMAVIIMASIWSHFGVNMIFFLMGLQSVPEELYECARIDGVNKVQQFIYITVPMLAPIMQIIIMLAIVEGMKMTDMVLVLTNGGPAGQTEVVMTYIFKYFFRYGGEAATRLQYGYASSMAVVTAIIIGIITILYLRFTKKMSKIY